MKTYSPNHPAVRQWRCCCVCGSKEIPATRRANICADCEPLTVRERTALVRHRQGIAQPNEKHPVRIWLGVFSLLAMFPAQAFCETHGVNGLTAVLPFGLAVWFLFPWIIENHRIDL